MGASGRYDDPIELRATTNGRAMPGLEMRIVDPESNRPLPTGSEGELVVRGSSMMRTYYRHAPAECFDVEGYFHTGDCGSLDETGHLHFLGRLKDVIKTAGVNVAAAEVEAALATHPAVKVAHVVPVPHPTRGENVAAFVVRQGAACSADEIVAHCRERLASYKVPRFVFFVDEHELPTLGSGKVDRRQLRERAAGLAKADGP
jgi:fatty-acyl-CoA synthase